MFSNCDPQQLWFFFTLLLYQLFEDCWRHIGWTELTMGLQPTKSQLLNIIVNAEVGLKNSFWIMYFKFRGKCTKYKFITEHKPLVSAKYRVLHISLDICNLPLLSASSRILFFHKITGSQYCQTHPGKIPCPFCELQTIS